MSSDQRTLQYTGGVAPASPLGIVIRDSVDTAGGQSALLALCNAAARSHPVVYVSAPNITLIGSTRTTHEALTDLGFVTERSRVELVEGLPEVPTVGIGEGVDADVYIGADRFTGAVSAEPTAINDSPTSVWGAGLAAMYAAAGAFRSAIGLPSVGCVVLSAWTNQPADRLVPTGPADLGRVDVGPVWLIGAGGVGASLGWWVPLLGIESSAWVVIDHDRVDLTNLNRSLGLFLADVARDGEGPRYKADAVAELIGGHSFPHTWERWAATDPPPADLVIPAANDFGVRWALAQYSHPMALTGTTSPNWTAELHLYRCPIDGCLDCRHPAASSSAFACSTAEVTTAEGSHDAALAFLSGTAGLLTAAALARLHAGERLDRTNHWQYSFTPTRRIITPNVWQCGGGVQHSLAAGARMKIFGSLRWPPER